MSTAQISVISIPVRDQEKSKSFYVDKMGFEVVSDTPFQDGQRWIMLKPEGSSTSIALVTWFKSMKPGTLKGIVLSVEDIHRAIAEFRMRGVPMTSDTIQVAPWGHWVSLEDPDGNGWIVQQDLLMEKEPEGPLDN